MHHIIFKNTELFYFVRNCVKFNMVPISLAIIQLRNLKGHALYLGQYYSY